MDSISATSQYYGMIGGGTLFILEQTPSGAIHETKRIEWSDGLFDVVNKIKHIFKQHASHNKNYPINSRSGQKNTRTSSHARLVMAAFKSGMSIQTILSQMIQSKCYPIVITKSIRKRCIALIGANPNRIHSWWPPAGIVLSNCGTQIILNPCPRMSVILSWCSVPSLPIKCRRYSPVSAAMGIWSYGAPWTVGRVQQSRHTTARYVNKFTFYSIHLIPFRCFFFTDSNMRLVTKWYEHDRYWRIWWFDQSVGFAQLSRSTGRIVWLCICGAPSSIFSIRSNHSSIGVIWFYHTHMGH